MTTYSKTIIKVSVHLPDDSPIFGESSTHVSLEDEAGGIYLKLEQCNDNIQNGCVTFNDIEHLEAVVSAAKELLQNAPKS
jgi:hypothetical protein